jgi:hypothetical protein
MKKTGLEGMTYRQLIEFGKEAEKRGDYETRDEVLKILKLLMKKHQEKKNEES